MLENLVVKRAQLFAKIMQYKVLNQRKPVAAYLNVTNRCNLHCRYCFVDTTKKMDELTTKEWKEFIDEIYLKGCQMVCLMGGEPLLHPDIEEIIEHIRSKKIICDVTTNGVLVSQKIDLVKRIDSLMVSLDGDEAANDANRGQGSFQQALGAIKIARENNVIVRINAVMTKQSQDSLEFLLDLADQHDLYVTFSIIAEFPCEDMETVRKIALSDDQIRNIFIRLKELRRKGRRVLFSESTLDYVISYPVPYNKIIFHGDSEHERFYRQKCLFGRMLFYVNANGDLYPCATFWNTEHYHPLNMRKVGFQKAWNNMANLKCLSCSCPGVPEWNRIMSFKGLLNGLTVTLQQHLAKNGEGSPYKRRKSAACIN